MTFYLIAIMTLGFAVAAMTLRNMIHCALCVAGAFGGLAMLYLQLDAEFVGFAQVLVYVGAVGILILFAVLLTRGTEVKSGVPVVSASWPVGVCVGGMVLAAIVTPILTSRCLCHGAVDQAQAPVKQIGDELMNQYVLPLEAIGLLLTAALIGAAVIAMHDKKSDGGAK